MFSKLFSSFLLLEIYVLSANASIYSLNDNLTDLLTTLQADHYGYIRDALDSTDNVARGLYFIDGDLKTNAQEYFVELANQELKQLAPLKEGCGQVESCLACFDSEGQITEIATNITATLVAFFDKQKTDFDSTIGDIKQNLLDSALLSTVVYERFKDWSDFETNAKNYYEQIRQALESERDLFNRIVKATSNKLISYSIDSTVQATDQMASIFNTISDCARKALKALERELDEINYSAFVHGRKDY